MKKKMKMLLGLLLAGMLCLTACGGASEFTDEVVLKVGEQEIMKSEYMVYLYTTTKSFISAAGEDVWNMDFDGQTADELVEERTISTIQSVIAAKEYAAANGIALTEEQKAELWNEETLHEAVAKLAQLKADAARVLAMEAMIDSIGEVTLEKEAFIREARRIFSTQRSAAAIRQVV